MNCSKSPPSNTAFKKSIVAIKVEVPTLHKIFLTKDRYIHQSTGTLVIPFAVAIINDNILGTPFFEKKTLKL